MAWQAIVFWKSFGTGPLGWHWRLTNVDLGLEEDGPADSAEQALAAVRAALRRHGVDPKAVAVEVWDEGVWEKC